MMSIAVTTGNNGAIERININGRDFNTYPGRIRTSPGVELRVEWKNCGDYWHAQFRITRISGRREDGAEVRFRIPYMDVQYRMKVWAARENFPKNLFELCGTDLAYGDVCYGTVLPMVTLLNPTEKIGLTIARKPGRPGGTLSFFFDSYHSDGMDIHLAKLAVPPGETVEQDFYFFGHENCWRPGLRQYIELFPECFAPPLSAVKEWGGAFAITNPALEPDFAPEFRPDWVEVHNHFPHYGEYAPETPAWESVILHDYPEERGSGDYTMSRERINAHIAKLHRDRIRAMLYIQVSGDCSNWFAEKNFPESIAREINGKIMPTWKECCFLNADPSLPFGKHINAMIDRFIGAYPEIDGVFLDQLCYQTMDYAHSDGKSADDGREIYEYGASYDAHVKKLADILHRQGKAILANGPFDLSAASQVDAVMAEGCSGISNTLKYLCVDKPMLVHDYTADVTQVEKALRNALLAGAGWSYGGSSRAVKLPEMSEEVADTFRQYLPLVKAVFNRRLYLDADPIELSPREPDVAYEVFSLPEGKGCLVALIQTGARLHYHAEVSCNLPGVKRVEKLFLGETGFTPASSAEGAVVLPENFRAAVLKFKC